MKKHLVFLLLFSACSEKPAVQSLDEDELFYKNEYDLDPLFSHNKSPDSNTDQDTESDSLASDTPPQKTADESASQKGQELPPLALLDPVEEEQSSSLSLENLIDEQTPSQSFQNQPAQALDALSLPISRPHRGSPGGLVANSLKTFQCRAKNQTESDFTLHILPTS